MGALIDLDSIKSAPVEDTFFPFFSVPNCISDTDKSLAKEFPNLEKGLHEIGFSQQEIDGILGDNWYKFYKNAFGL